MPSLPSNNPFSSGLGRVSFYTSVLLYDFIFGALFAIDYNLAITRVFISAKILVYSIVWIMVVLLSC